MTALIDMLVDFLRRLFGMGSETEKTPSSRTDSSVPNGHYQRVESLLTQGEMAFYQTLREALPPGMVVQCKVRMVDLITPKQDDLTAFRRVSQKHIDFVLCDSQTLEPLAAVELDDRSHQRPDRVQRDIFVNAAFRDARLPLLRIPAQRTYNLHDIRQTLFAHSHKKAA